MYKFSHFTEKDQATIIAFMHENPFAFITGKGETYPVATQIPLTVKIKAGKVFLEGHMMKKTDHHTAFEKNNHVLVLFTGPDCFVDAAWYSDPHMGSTWNYMTVHAKGTISFMDEADTRNVVKELSDKYAGTASASAYDNLPGEYIDRMVKAITGFSIEVESVDNVFKLSQNRDEASRKNIIEQLKKRGEANASAIANEMEKRL